jgi:hypothetical protein
MVNCEPDRAGQHEYEPQRSHGDTDPDPGNRQGHDGQRIHSCCSSLHGADARVAAYSANKHEMNLLSDRLPTLSVIVIRPAADARMGPPDELPELPPLAACAAVAMFHCQWLLATTSLTVTRPLTEPG